MSPTLFLEAFGQLSPNLAIIDDEKEDLYSIFNARAELMGWSTLSLPRPGSSLLWGMEEAELTAGLDASRIGWVQVGLGLGESNIFKPGVMDWIRRVQIQFKAHPKHSRSAVEPAEALPALTQCLNDALGRFGIVELSGFQVTATDLDPSTRSGTGYPISNLFDGINWFNTAQKATAEAVVAFDYELLGSHTEAELVACLQRRNTEAFAFGPMTVVPEPHSIQVPIEVPWWYSISPSLGVAVTLPEWTASVAAWVLAIVIDTARALTPDVRNCAVRITRVR